MVRPSTIVQQGTGGDVTMIYIGPKVASMVVRGPVTKRAYVFGKNVLTSVSPRDVALLQQAWGDIAVKPPVAVPVVQVVPQMIRPAIPPAPVKPAVVNDDEAVAEEKPKATRKRGPARAARRG